MGQGWTSPLMASGETPLSVPSFDVRVFNPNAPSNRQSLNACYRKHENIKKGPTSRGSGKLNTAHSPHSSCPSQVALATPLPCATRGWPPCAKWNQPYSSTMAWIRCRLTFSLLRSAIQCIRGARSAGGHASREFHPLDLILAEAQFA